MRYSECSLEGLLEISVGVLNKEGLDRKGGNMKMIKGGSKMRSLKIGF